MGHAGGPARLEPPSGPVASERRSVLPFHRAVMVGEEPSPELGIGQAFKEWVLIINRLGKLQHILMTTE